MKKIFKQLFVVCFIVGFLSVSISKPVLATTPYIDTGIEKLPYMQNQKEPNFKVSRNWFLYDRALTSKEQTIQVDFPGMRNATLTTVPGQYFYWPVDNYGKLSVDTIRNAPASLATASQIYLNSY